MREIEFRGKESFNDNWAYGDLIKRANYYTLFREEFKINKDQTIAFNEIEKTIRPYTVGQYTGLKDKNGTKIFEGDILLIVPAYIANNNKNHYDYVAFADGCFYLKNAIMYAELSYGVSGYEVVGNVYDNPELLEVKDED